MLEHSVPNESNYKNSLRHLFTNHHTPFVRLTSSNKIRNSKMKFRISSHWIQYILSKFVLVFSLLVHFYGSFQDEFTFIFSAWLCSIDVLLFSWSRFSPCGSLLQVLTKNNGFRCDLICQIDIRQVGDSKWTEHQ